jgi:hypothetical protein
MIVAEEADAGYPITLGAVEGLYKAECYKLACYRSTSGGIVGQLLSADAQKSD